MPVAHIHTVRLRNDAGQTDACVDTCSQNSTVVADVWLSLTPKGVDTSSTLGARKYLAAVYYYCCCCCCYYYSLSLSLSLSLSVLTSVFPGEPGFGGFIEAKDDVNGGDNWSYKSCKASVKSSPPTNQHSTTTTTTINTNSMYRIFAPIPDIYYFQNTLEVTSVQLILSFSLTVLLTVSLTIFVQSPWSRLCCIRLFKFVIITLRYVTYSMPDRLFVFGGTVNCKCKTIYE